MKKDIDSIRKDFLYLRIVNRKLIDNSLPIIKASNGNRKISLFGEIEFIADYNSLSLSRYNEEYAGSSILDKLCRSDDLEHDIHLITELVGCYILVFEDVDIVTHIYRSGEITPSIYYGEKNKEIFVHTSWLKILDFLKDIHVISENLQTFIRQGTLDLPDTLFRNLWQSKPYCLYRLEENRLIENNYVFPGFHTIDRNNPPSYNIDDYIEALSCYKPFMDQASIAYSSGVDSHILLEKYNNKVTELLTLFYEEPFALLSREQEKVATKINAKKYEKDLIQISINFNNLKKLNSYFYHLTLKAPFTSFLSVHFYELYNKSNNDIILDGFCADTIWDWGLHQIWFSKKKHHSTSGWHVYKYISNSFKNGTLIQKIKRLIRKMLLRWTKINSFNKILIPYILQIPKEFGVLSSYPYTTFILDKYWKYGSVTETLAIRHAAQYFGKRSITPYLSPIALHVNSRIKRRGFFDLKAPLRKHSPSCEASIVDIKENKNWKHWGESPFAKQIPFNIDSINFLSIKDKELLNKSDTMNTNPISRIAKLHIYYVFNYVKENIEK